MLTVEAVIDKEGKVRFQNDAGPIKPARVLVTFLDEGNSSHEISMLSQHALSGDWLNDEEDAAWAHLQKPT